MMRILSVLLLIAGMLAAGIGGAALLEEFAPKEMVVESGLPAPEAEAAVQTAAAEPVAGPAPEAIGVPESAAREAAAQSADPEIEAGASAALTEEEMTFNFQTEMEPGLAGPVAAPDVSEATATAPPARPSLADRLKTVPVAHETPRTAEYKRAFDVTFAIDATGDTTAADALPGRGTIEEGEAKVSEKVEVRLSGANFNIVAASPAVQSMSPMSENTWRWSVTALSAGEHDLVFEVFAMDSDTAMPLRTFRDTVTVKVSGLNRAIAFADQANPLFVLLGGLGSALAGLFGAIKFFGKR
ncbi:hypothetical protein [Hyphomonas sp.]|uniref:hypothetical protein n=1 Tax=Hyphomonas sp. TaxID=87 RepID=UPI0033409DD8